MTLEDDAGAALFHLQSITQKMDTGSTLDRWIQGLPQEQVVALNRIIGEAWHLKTIWNITGQGKDTVLFDALLSHMKTVEDLTRLLGQTNNGANQDHLRYLLDLPQSERAQALFRLRGLVELLSSYALKDRMVLWLEQLPPQDIIRLNKVVRDHNHFAELWDRLGPDSKFSLPALLHAMERQTSGATIDASAIQEAEKRIKSLAGDIPASEIEKWLAEANRLRV